MAVKPIPDGYHTITPYLAVEGASAVLDFVKKAFGAEETVHMDGPDGKIAHAEVRIGDSVVMVGDASSTDQGKSMPGMVFVYVDDADKTYQQAIEAGGKSLREPRNEFYGDRMSGVEDPAGNQWWIATHVEDVSPEEMERRMQQLGQQ